MTSRGCLVAWRLRDVLKADWQPSAASMGIALPLDEVGTLMRTVMVVPAAILEIQPGPWILNSLEHQMKYKHD